MINLSARFLPPEDDSVVMDRIRVTPPPIVDLARYETEEGCKLLELSHKKIYVPTTQIVHLIRRICGIARAHLNNAYSSESVYRERCYIKDLTSKEPWLPTALVGLGGTGKTQLIKAIQRLCAADEQKIALDGLPSYPFEPIWLMTMSTGLSLNALLTPLIVNDARGDNVLIAAAKNAYTNGVGLVVLDESQFITSTQEGHAKAAKTLMHATYIGPPFIFCANYTLINKLERRPQQERDRLLSNVIALLPEERGSEAYRDTFAGLLRIFGDAVASDLAVDADTYSEAMHNYVYGIDRKTAILLQLAWRYARENGEEILKFSHIERAYHSELFTSHREEVEILKAQSVQNMKLKDDLWCSFVPPLKSNVLHVDAFDVEKKKRANSALSRSTLSKEDREAYDIFTKEETTKKQNPSGKVLNLSKSDKSLSALQAAGAELINQYRPTE
jgi:hypothetical protein